MEHRSLAGCLEVPVLYGEKQGMHLPSKLDLNVLSGAIKIGVIQIISDHHQVNVALGSVSSFRDGAVHESALDHVAVRFERLSNRLGQAHRFLDKSSQLFKNGSLCVGLVMRLIADALYRHQPTSL